MARPLRIQYEGAYYHVMNRGRHRASIYFCDADYKAFLKTLQHACEVFNAQIVAYCLMKNHYHLLVHTPEGNLSRVMRHVNGVYTQIVNKRHNKDGVLFKGRYKSILVEEENYLLKLIRYIHLNPLKAGILKNSLNDYKWSSHRDYLNLKHKSSWLNPRLGLIQLSPKLKHAVMNYEAMIREGLDEETKMFYEKQRVPAVFGSKDFISNIEEMVIKDQDSLADIPAKRGIVGKYLIKRIKIVLCKKYNIKSEDLLTSRRGEENIPRKLAVALMRDLSGSTYKELAIRFNFKSDRSVAKIYERFKRERQKHRNLDKSYEQIKSLCRQVET